MAKVQRKMLMKNEWIVEHGLDAALTSPSESLFKELKEGRWENLESKTYPDEYLPRLYYRLVDLVSRLAKGEELPMDSFNQLEDGIWELKAANVRVTFFDTDGDGTYIPKAAASRKILGKHYWDIPEDLAEFIRLGAVWEKISQAATPEQIESSITFRREDLAHDV